MTNMSNNTNTQLEEELADLQEEFDDQKLEYERARRESNEAHEWEEKRRDDFRLAEKNLLNFKERMTHEN